MEYVFFETTASGDVLTDANGTPLAIFFEATGGGDGTGSGVWKAPVESFDELPMVGNTADDIRLVRNELLLYSWDGDSWEIIGLPWDSDGGNDGGGTGTGSSFWKDPVGIVTDLPVDGNTVNDLRYVQDTRRIYAWNGAAWQALADNMGGGGSGGIGSVDFRSDLDAIENPTVGDMYLVKDENAIYVWDEVMVDKEPVTSWRVLHAEATAKLLLGESLPWFEPDGDVATAFTVRSQNQDIAYNDFSTDPELVTEGYGGLVYYPPDENGPGGYEPNRQVTDWGLNYIRRESRDILFRKEWDVDAWGTVESDYVFNGLHSLSVTVGRPGFDGYATLYGSIDRTENKLRFGEVTGANQSMNYSNMESVDFPSPPAGSTFYIWMYRRGDVITLYAGIDPPGDDPYYEAEVTHVVTYMDGWLQPPEGLYPGFGSLWGDLQYGHRFEGASFHVPDAWRELVLTMKSNVATSPEVNLILADTRTGWLLGGGDGAPPDGAPHIIQQDETSLPQRGKLRFQQGSGLVGLNAFDNNGVSEDATTVSAWIDEAKLKQETKKTVTEQKGSTTGFKTLGLNAGFSQPVLVTDPEVAGPRYKLSYQFDGGWIKFRGYFISDGPVADALIGTIDESFCPPHPVRGIGVREDNALCAVRVDPNGDVHFFGVQTGNNHLDGFSFYLGKGPMEIMGTFISDPDDPYYAAMGGPGEFGGRTIQVFGAGIFEYPRNTNEGVLTSPMFPPTLEGWAGFGPFENMSAHWAVIDGPDVGQNGTLTYPNGGITSEADGLHFTIPSGLDGTVRLTFTHIGWEEYYNV